MSYQRGSLKKVKRREGEIWVLRYRVTNSEGRRVENVMPIGLVREFPKDEDARREADRLGLPVRINDSPLPGRIQFDFLAEHYLKVISGRIPCARNRLTPSVTSSISCAPISCRVSETQSRKNQAARYSAVLKSLHENNGLAWTTIAKMRGVMHRIYKIGILHEHVAKNPAQYVETRSKTDYKAVVITPAQTLGILKPSLRLFTSRWCSPAQLRRSVLRRS